MKIKLLFILFTFYSICCYSSTIDIFDSLSNIISYNINNTEVIKFLVNELLKNISNVTFESDDKDYECFNSLINNITITKKMFSACGKYLGDFGFEDICNEIEIIEKKKNITVNYFILNFTLVIPSFNQSSQYNELHFLNESKSIMGLCLYDSCMSFFNKFIDEKNVKFINFINNYTGIENGKLGFVTNDIIKNKIGNSGIDYWLFFLFFILTLFWCIFIIVYGFIKICQNKENNKNVISNENEKELENKSDDEYIEFKNKNQNNEKEEIKDYKYKIKKILSFLEITKNFEKLFTLSNDLYNNKGLESLALIRTIIAFFIVYYYTFYALIYFPPKDQFNPNFFTSFWFYFIRLSGMSFIGYIILDGTVMSFKLMCKIRKYFMYEVNSEISINLFIKFFWNSLSNIVIFFFIFGTFYNCSIYFNYSLPIIKDWLNLGFLFNYYSLYFLIEENNEIFLTKNFLDILYVPFKYVKESISFYTYLNENNIEEYSIMRAFTYDFVYISINELYSFIVSLIIIYLCCYFRSKIIDICLFIIMIIYFLLSITYFRYKTVQNEVYEIKYKMVINQNWFEKNPFLFINIYFIGVIIGIIIFYFKDMKSNVKLYNFYDNTINEYPPFNLCAKVAKFFIPIKNSKKKIILFFCIFVFLISFYYFSFDIKFDSHWSIYNEEKDNQSKKEGIIFFYLCTYYVKVIFIILFSIILIILSSFSKSDIVYSLTNLQITNFVERESRVILCCSQAVLLFCVCAFRYQFILEHKAFFIHSIGIYLFILLISTIITLFIEIPIKHIIKNFTRTFDWDLYYSKELTNEIREDNFVFEKDLLNDK